jgi:hypothetical protein
MLCDHSVYVLWILSMFHDMLLGVHITLTSCVLHSNAVLKIALTDIIDSVFNLQNIKIHHITRHKYVTSNYLLEKINRN